jgi:hypothetical protein
MMNDTREVSQILQAASGPWDGIVLVTHLAGVVGRLTDDVLSIEGKIALPVEDGRFAHNLAHALFQLIWLSNRYHIDLEGAWTEFLEQGRARLSDEAMVTALRDTIRQNLERQQQP